MTLVKALIYTARNTFLSAVFLLIAWLCGLWVLKVTDDVRYGSDSGVYHGGHYHIVWREHPIQAGIHWATWGAIPGLFGIACCIGAVVIWLPISQAKLPVRLPFSKNAHNHGKPWSRSEDATLTDQFEKMISIEDIAIIHSRSPRAIRMRLEKLGKLAPQSSYNNENSKVEQGGPAYLPQGVGSADP